MAKRGRLQNFPTKVRDVLSSELLSRGQGFKQNSPSYAMSRFLAVNAGLVQQQIVQFCKLMTAPEISQQPPRVAFLMPNWGGGVERVVFNMLDGFVRDGLCLDLICDCIEGLDLSEIPAGVRVVDLRVPIQARLKSALKLVIPLARYLRREQPDVLFSHLVFVNVVAVMARSLARVPVYLALVEHNILFPPDDRAADGPKSRFLWGLMRWLYPRADRAIAVSQALADALQTGLHLPPTKVRVIYNPVVGDRLLQQARAALAHPWLQAGQPPVFVAAGRLVPAKDFPTLLQAFARLRQAREARLIILGEGDLREALEGWVRTLELGADVAIPGFANNPYAYMSRAAALVLSSRWEGLPTVLIEAIACGCQVVSTDCPHGPREILAEGRYGRLVPVGDVAALATAMELALDAPIDGGELQRRSRDFGVEKSVAEYLNLIRSEASRTLI